GGSETTPPKPKTMADAETKQQAPAVSVVSEAPSAEETLRAERKRVADINAMSDQVKARWPEAVGMAAKAVEAGTTQEVFQRSLFEIMRGEPAGTPGSNNQSQSKQEKRDISKFSFLKVIRGSLPPGSEGYVPLEGLEKEMAQEAAREALAHNVVVKGIGIPACVIGADTFHDRYLQRKMAGRMSQRDMTTTAGQGGYTIETDVPSFIDVLWENTVFNELGVTFFTGLTGDVSFPRFVRGATPAHKAENATADEISPTTEQVLLSPRRLPAFIDLSKMLIRQSAFSIELWVRNYLAMQFAVEMENVGIEGGGSEEPTGILGTVGIGAVVAGDPDGAAITWADVINLKREVAKDNALQQRLGYLGNPDVTAALQTTDRTSNTSVFIMGDDPNRLAGYPYRDTTNVPNDLTKGAGTALSALIFGNWADLYVGQWGGVDILTNPYTKAKEGLVEVVAELYYDLEVARPVSFAAIQDIVTT
ncbi:MAG TPA: phage major capsid protein, partial [Terrimicrobiaceae bacterium]|nr:phage major capsid protein [Terrimicrobiaceae bacterium]